MSTESMEELSSKESWALLSTVDLGRLAVTVDGSADIFPVNFVVNHGTIVVRTAAGTKVAAARIFPAVAFEVDGMGSDGRLWSVVIRGRLESPQRVDDVPQTEQPPVHPAQGSPKGYFVRVIPEVVTGRRFRPVPASHWDPTSTLHPDSREPSPGRASRS